MNTCFGTDGIRGVFGVEITPRLCYFAGRALCLYKKNPTVLLARDTRPSGPVLAAAFLRGVRAGGGICLDLGVLPTPGLSFCMPQSGADFGVVVSASHNPKEYNGLKFFSAGGTKFSAAEEKETETLLSALLREGPQEKKSLQTEPRKGESPQPDLPGEENLQTVLPGEENLQIDLPGEKTRQKNSAGEETLQTQPRKGESPQPDLPGEENLQTVLPGEENLQMDLPGEKTLQKNSADGENLQTNPAESTFPQNLLFKTALFQADFSESGLSEAFRLRESYRFRLCSVPLAEGVKGDLSGLKIALDLAGGSTNGFAESAFLSRGARVSVTGGVPGTAINDGCGATHSERISAFTRLTGADIGFAFDGDGDRVVCCDGDGKIFDGDDLLVFLSRALAAKKAVGTVLTNGGVARALQGSGTEFFRSAVGDRKVADLMKRTGATVGAETAGHILLFPEMITGDGVLAALRVAAFYRKAGAAFFACPGYKKYPSASAALRKTKEISDEELQKIGAAIVGGEGDETCRAVLRKSGTEPVIRVYAESENGELPEKIVARVAETLQNRGIIT